MTRKTIWLIAMIAVLASCEKKSGRHQKAGTERAGEYPEMSFDQDEFDFGTIKQGDKVSHEFTFENTGGAELLISNASGSCGCTVPEYPKEAIAPGGSGKVKVTFNSSGKHGIQHKTVTLSTNTRKGKELLHIKTSINSGPKAN